MKYIIKYLLDIEVLLLKFRNLLNYKMLHSD